MYSVLPALPLSFLYGFYAETYHAEERYAALTVSSGLRPPRCCRRNGA